ncbi:MAG: hypothetical protein ACK5V5_13830 [Cyclobacteriaceae bacterium]|jgi:hypothetical protein|nr:redoxin domain-containing protein [Flammeovirgaceae bacterium]
MKKNIVFLLALTCLQPLMAQVLVQDFKLTNVANNEWVSMASFQSCSGYAIIFTSNACPYDEYYRDRIKTLVNAYQGKIQFILINSHPDPEENTNAMKAAYQTWNITVPYLADKDQQAMDCFAARKSPECFLVKSEAGKYRILYSGALDDNPQAAQQVADSYLQSSIEALLANQAIAQPSNRAAGCAIRKK